MVGRGFIILIHIRLGARAAWILLGARAALSLQLRAGLVAAVRAALILPGALLALAESGFFRALAGLGLPGLVTAGAGLAGLLARLGGPRLILILVRRLRNRLIL